MRSGQRLGGIVWALSEPLVVGAMLVLRSHAECGSEVAVGLRSLGARLVSLLAVTRAYGFVVRRIWAAIPSTFSRN